MVDKEKLRQKIHFIRHELKKLEEIKQLTYEKFVKEPLFFDASLRMLQVAIEAMIDICSHIVAREAFGIPKNYRDGFKTLTDHKMLEAEMLDTYIKMTKFRNRIVHIYDKVKTEEVYEIIQEHLPDFERFIASIVKAYFQD